MMQTIDRIGRVIAGVFVTPVARLLVKLGLTADMMTLVGLVGNMLVAVMIVQEQLVWAGVLILVAGVFDMLDGAVARESHKTRRSGALLDSVIDRYSEAFIFGGLVVYFFKQQHLLAITLSFMAIIGSLLVSYIRARAEGLNIECRVGIMQRAERVVLLALGLIFASWGTVRWEAPFWGETPFLVLVLGVLAVLTNITAVHRLVFSYSELDRVQRG
ncbi:MAG: CDP-alcohol phosphatidyltransferase family protein [Candidatus Poribacteria bacterium]|nr:CDP-alcohol phosphatidyltransferase family protein [Candidatus Poribacteria bacterium]